MTGIVLTASDSDTIIPYMSLTLQTMELLKLALDEDMAHGDVTTEGLGFTDAIATAEIRVNESAVISGLEAAGTVFRMVDSEVEYQALRLEGDWVNPGDIVARIKGRASGLLAAERTALNLLMRLSGVASLARAFTEKVADTGVMLLDTRKTTPGMRDLEKAAARHGGFHNHRYSLDSGVLIKDNHIALSGGVAQAIRLVKAFAPPALKVEVEVRTLKQAQEAVQAGAEALLLDNMTPKMVAETCNLLKNKVFIEVSGNITLDNIREYALAGPNAISTSAIFKYSRWTDMSMNIKADK